MSWQGDGHVGANNYSPLQGNGETGILGDGETGKLGTPPQERCAWALGAVAEAIWLLEEYLAPGNNKRLNELIWRQRRVLDTAYRHLKRGLDELIGGGNGHTQNS